VIRFDGSCYSLSGVIRKGFKDEDEEMRDFLGRGLGLGCG